MKPPIIICGAHGGGTSYVTKLLRWSGLFVGNDSGSKYDRKCHESEVFMKTNCNIMTAVFNDSEMMRDNSWSTYPEFLKRPEIIEKVAISINKGSLLDAYTGNNLSLTESTWAWKDPRNSVTLPVWKNCFPGARILVIHRTWLPEMKNENPKSPSGLWFKKTSSDHVRNCYMNPPGIEPGDDVKTVEFNQVITSVESFNELLDWIGIKCLTSEDYNKLLLNTSIEKEEIRSL
jgi:hypothetical protein